MVGGGQPFKKTDELWLLEAVELRRLPTSMPTNHSRRTASGLPDFLGKIYQNGEKDIPNGHKIFQMVTKYTKWSQNIPNGHKIYQMATKYTKYP
jgi:hypothetical protein